ncbi:MAG: PAS domain S-box protein [Deltaproteobacteria bacterium]|nr:PAS domain S-box protein [Deltaproteobacteria bacterium]
MKDKAKTKEQLISELAVLRKRIADLEGAEVDHKQTEAALKASVLQWQTVFDTIHDPICLLDIEGKILRCNKAMKNFLGKTQEEVVGHTCWELVHGTSKPIEGCPIVQMKETLRRETLILQLDNRWVNVIVDPLTDATGALIGAIHIISDVTEHKQTEETVKKQLEEITSYYDNAPIGLAVLDTSLRYLRINNRLAEINGISAAKHIGKTVEEIVPTLATRAREIISEIIKTGEPITDVEFRGETKAQPGVKRYWLEGWYPLKDK